MRNYTKLDLLRFRKFSNEKQNKKLSPPEMISAYDKKYPELSAKEKLINLSKALKINGLHKALTGEDIPGHYCYGCKSYFHDSDPNVSIHKNCKGNKNLGICVNAAEFINDKDEPHWKTLWNSESKNSTWEIWHDSENKNITLHYVPEEDYSDKDIKIKVSYEQFEDLIDFIKQLDK